MPKPSRQRRRLTLSRGPRVFSPSTNNRYEVLQDPEELEEKQTPFGDGALLYSTVKMSRPKSVYRKSGIPRRFNKLRISDSKLLNPRRLAYARKPPPRRQIPQLRTFPKTGKCFSEDLGSLRNAQNGITARDRSLLWSYFKEAIRSPRKFEVIRSQIVGTIVKTNWYWEGLEGALRVHPSGWACITALVPRALLRKTLQMLCYSEFSTILPFQSRRQKSLRRDLQSFDCVQTVKAISLSGRSAPAQLPHFGDNHHLVLTDEPGHSAQSGVS
jgi:hypothetical protein